MSTWHDMDRTVLAPRVDDVTEAWAWASSPLGNPTDERSDLGHEFPTDLITPATNRKSIDKLWVGAGVIGLIGAGVALSVALLAGP
ncbi:hypothetical protein, partial [Mycobacterium sp. 1081908.1]|uniref:hypothetical protein n=1 Tax=Mycobacterium sp. 1081908.1 TaxID=1834066 RepID=UPI0012E9CF63